MVAAVRDGSVAADAEFLAVPELAAADVLKRLVCGHCMKCPMNARAELRRCSGCHQHVFCARGADGETTSARCHIDGWKAHKPVCKAIQRQLARSKAAAAAAAAAVEAAAAAAAASAEQRTSEEAARGNGGVAKGKKKRSTRKKKGRK